ncbi:MAG: hypothetical protein FWG42_01980 [Clostridiales bacterium]|nr:hypothetical protein [Clostridiales bacterium]
MKAVYFFCTDTKIERVAPQVFESVCGLKKLTASEKNFDGKPVLEHVDYKGNLFSFVETSNVLCYDYAGYLPYMNELFGEYDFAGQITWHEGANAPERVLTVHSSGDVPSGVFGTASPLLFKNLIIAVERNRQAANLDGFFTSIEGTHWSGIDHDQKAEYIARFPVPIYDVEIGSMPEAWHNKDASDVLASSLFEVFTPFSDKYDKAFTVLAAGGMHFEENFTAAILNADYPISIGHHLPNQWLVSGEYENGGIEKVEKAVKSIIGGIDAVVFHEGLKGAYKQLCRDTGEKYGVPARKHKALRSPEELLNKA